MLFSTLPSWSTKFAKWALSAWMIVYKGNPLQCCQLQNEIRVGQFQVLLTTYEYIIKDRPVMSKMKWVESTVPSHAHIA
jgi:ATP-dependent helicase STH1/SNF2